MQGTLFEDVPVRQELKAWLDAELHVDISPWIFQKTVLNTEMVCPVSRGTDL